MEAFGDPIIFGKPPHTNDFFPPWRESIAKRLEMFKATVFQIFDVFQESEWVVGIAMLFDAFALRADEVLV